MIVRRPALLLAAALAALVALAATLGAAGDRVPENLQVLPKTMSRSDVKKLMKQYKKALGVNCKHCHNTKNYAEDVPKKEQARRMMRMVNEINAVHLKGYDAKVTCMTCHRGDEQPPE